MKDHGYESSILDGDSNFSFFFNYFLQIYEKIKYYFMSTPIPREKKNLAINIII